MTKAELRAKYLSAQKTISAQDRAAKSSAISDLFFTGFDLTLIKYLHLFLPIEKFNEVDTRVIVARVWKEYPHVQTIVPRVDFETSEMQNLKFAPEMELVRNAWQIEEPTHNEYVETETIDMVLVPGLCFDQARHRVGYGKGFYDRFLRKCRPECVKIGLSFFHPVERIDDVHEGDEQLDRVITPERIYTALLPPAQAR
ncbi:MAG: 5-formyltetrahydrofolate cyclo-ligase [Pyrinomonadaceae bacterium]